MKKKFDPSWKAPPAIPPKDIVQGTALGWKWGRMRKAYMRRQPWCERCGLNADVVHHIVPRSVDPSRTYDWSNLMSLCNDCHDKEHGMGYHNPNRKDNK